MRARNNGSLQAYARPAGLLPGMLPEPQSGGSARGIIRFACPLPQNYPSTPAVRVSTPKRATPVAPRLTYGSERMDLNEPSIERLRLKLRYKVLYHVGRNCADVDDLVQETLARFFRAEQRNTIRNMEEFGPFLNGVCRNVILE